MKVLIEKLDDFGRGIAYIDNKVTFIKGAIAGDVLDIKIVKSKKSYNEAILEKIIKPSKKRINPACPYFLKCGGCSLQNMCYKDTAFYKKEKVINILKKNNFSANIEFIENPKSFNYRNKISLKIKEKRIGFYQEKSHDVIEINECLIANKAINKVIPLIKNWHINNGNITIRCNNIEEILIIINTKDKVNIDIEKLKSVCKLCGIVLNDKCIYGDNFLYERINDLVFRVSYDAFFQVNFNIASKLFKIIEENVSEDDYVMDLYSGVGTLSLSASKKCNNVLGIEVVPNAVMSAIFNAKINKLKAEFLLNDASDVVNNIDAYFNKLIVDPPRSGLSKSVIDMILEKLPKQIIYVSCDIQTLMRDLKLLEKNYEIKKVYALDMFSYTYHVECICILKLH